MAVPYCSFDEAPRGVRSFREFSGGFAQILMQEPMRIAPFKCAPGLMGVVSTFVDQQGRFRPVADVLARRAEEGLAPRCGGRKGETETAPFLWE